jgi:hypothetical protein
MIAPTLAPTMVAYSHRAVVVSGEYVLESLPDTPIASHAGGPALTMQGCPSCFGFPSQEEPVV